MMAHFEEKKDIYRCLSVSIHVQLDETVMLRYVHVHNSTTHEHMSNHCRH